MTCYYRSYFFLKSASFPPMKALEKAEKDKIKFQYAVALNIALQSSKLKSYRALAKEAGMESSHVQAIAVGQKDISLSTLVALNDALKISFSKFSEIYDSIGEKEKQDFIQKLKKQRIEKGKAKKQK